MASRFRLYDNGGESADRYTLIDCKACSCGHGDRSYIGFSQNPYHPQGIGVTGDLDAKNYHGHVRERFRGLGKRVRDTSAMPNAARHCALSFMRDFGATKAQLRAMFGDTMPAPPKSMFE